MLLKFHDQYIPYSISCGSNGHILSSALAVSVLRPHAETRFLQTPNYRCTEMLLLNYIDDEDELLQVESAVVCTRSTTLADPVSRHEISLNHYGCQHVRQNMARLQFNTRSWREVYKTEALGENYVCSSVYCDRSSFSTIEGTEIHVAQ